MGKSLAAGAKARRCFTRRKPPLLASWRHQYISWSPISWARHHCWLIDKKRQGCGVIGCVSKTLQVAGADVKGTGKELGQKGLRDRVFCLVSRLFCISLTNCKPHVNMSNHTISGRQKQVPLFEIHGIHYMKSRCIGNKVSGQIHIWMFLIMCKNITFTSRYFEVLKVNRWI